MQYYKCVFAVLLVAAAATAVSSDSEQSFAEATSFVQAWQGEGKDLSKCGQLADDEIQEIITVCGIAQVSVNKAAKGGDDCCKRGSSAVCDAQTQVTTTTTETTSCKNKVVSAGDVKISLPPFKYSSLKKGKCGFIFNDKRYRNIKTNIRKIKNECKKLKGQKKAYTNTFKDNKRLAKKSVKKCQNQEAKGVTTAYKAAVKVCLSKQNKKAYLRAQHMKCVLAGKKVSSCRFTKMPTINKMKFKGVKCPASITYCNGGSSKTKKAATTGKKGMINNRRF